MRSRWRVQRQGLNYTSPLRTRRRWQMKFGDWLEYGTRALDEAGLCFGHGTDNAADEAAWLLLSALRLPVDESLPGPDTPVSPEQEEAIRSLLAQRIESRQPLAYLLGEAYFAGLRFEVGPEVLVPRSPIAELIVGRFRPWLQHPVSRALDLCTGSGCIGIAMAHHMPGMSVDAVDISPEALAVARRNCALHNVQEAVTVIESDLFSALEGRRYGLIVANPPYVGEASWNALPAEYQSEPRSGLVSPGEGLALPLAILRDAPEFMEEGALLVCEIGESAAALDRLLADLPLTWVEFEHGGEGVFTIDRDELLDHRPAVERALESLSHVA